MTSRTRSHHARLIRGSIDLPAAADVRLSDPHADRERKRICARMSIEERIILGVPVRVNRETEELEETA
jgi:hypothetical protein